LKEEDEVRIKVERAGVCGSDLSIFEGELPGAQLPVILGHEVSGVVMEAGHNHEELLGQRVALIPTLSCGSCPFCENGENHLCSNLRFYGLHLDGAFAEEMVVKAHRVRALPPSMSYDEGALIEPTAVALHALNRAQIGGDEALAILGAGSIGLLLLQLAKANGLSFAMATDLEESKLLVARQLGADSVLNGDKEGLVEQGLKHLPQGFDIVCDLVGLQSTLDQAIGLARRGGKIICLATPHLDHRLQLDYTPFFRKELMLIVSRIYKDSEFDEASSLIASGKIVSKSIINARYPLEQAAQALKVFKKKAGVIKAYIEPNPGSSPNKKS
jgi:2-desacetyl-2-hydroxyethyl bacteriochlorophyllide A dehydrogenase